MGKLEHVKHMVNRAAETVVEGVPLALTPIPGSHGMTTLGLALQWGRCVGAHG
jgi:hypothetical protein